MIAFIKKKILSNRIYRYIIVGITNNIIYYGLFLSLVYLIEVHYSISMTVSFIISIVTGYFLHTGFTFSVKQYHLVTFLKYFFLYTLSIFLNYLILYIFIDFLNYYAWFAQIIGTILIAMFLFFCLKTFIYKT